MLAEIAIANAAFGVIKNATSNGKDAFVNMLIADLEKEAE